MSYGPNTTQSWLLVDDDPIEQPLTRKDRSDLAKYGYEPLLRRLWIGAGAALAACAITLLLGLIVPGPLAETLLISTALVLFAVSAQQAFRVRRIEYALNVEVRMQEGVLNPAQPHGWRDSDVRRPAREGTRSGGRNLGRDRCGFEQ
jgi:hypothetical protein